MDKVATRRGMIYRRGGWVPLVGQHIKVGQPPAGTYAKPLHPHPGELCPNCGASVAWYHRNGGDECGNCLQLWQNMMPRRGVPVEDVVYA